MEIKTRKLNFIETKLVAAMLKKSGIDFTRIDWASKEDIVSKVATYLIENYDEIADELIKLVSSVTELKKEQVETLPIDEFFKIVTDVWKASTEMLGFSKLLKPAKSPK